MTDLSIIAVEQILAHALTDPDTNYQLIADLLQAMDDANTPSMDDANTPSMDDANTPSMDDANKPSYSQVVSDASYPALTTPSRPMDNTWDEEWPPLAPKKGQRQIQTTPADGAKRLVF